MLVFRELAPGGVVALPPPPVPGPRSVAGRWIDAVHGGQYAARALPLGSSRCVVDGESPGRVRGWTAIAAGPAARVLVADASGASDGADGSIEHSIYQPAGERCIGVAVVTAGSPSSFQPTPGSSISEDEGGASQVVAECSPTPGPWRDCRPGSPVVDASGRTVEVVRADAPR